MPVRDRLLAIGVALLWGVNFLAIDIGLRHFPPFLFVALRFAVIAVPTLLLVPRPNVPLRWLVGYGLGFGTVQYAFLFLAMRLGMPTGLASLVLQASAPFTVLLGTVFLRERPSRRRLIGVGLAVAGMGIILWQRSVTAAALPVLLSLLAALGWAVGNVCNRKARPDNPLHLTLWMAVVPPLPMLALSLAFEGPAADLRAFATLPTRGGVAALVALAFIVGPSTVLAAGIWTTLMRRHPAGVVAPFSLLVPVVGIATAWLVLGERPTPVELGAGVIVIGGVLLGSLDRTRFRRTPALSAEIPAVERVG